MGRSRPRDTARGEAKAQLQKGDIGRLAVRQRFRGLYVGALDEPDVDPRAGQRVQISVRPHQIGLQRGTESIRQAACGNVEDARQDGVRLRCFFGTDLQASTCR